jgi:hypothetical protein
MMTLLSSASIIISLLAAILGVRAATVKVRVKHEDKNEKS